MATPATRRTTHAAADLACARADEALTAARKGGEVAYLRPDGKSQVTVEYDGYTPVHIDTIVVSAQHDDVDMDKLRADITEKVIRPVLPENLVDAKTRILVNPTGRYVIGGPTGDSGLLTGRKIIVDTYGGYARHGGGAFSGKDPTKVDRSGAYIARYAAKHVVAAGFAKQCEIQLAYAIGVACPVSVRVDTFGTGTVDDAAIERARWSPGCLTFALQQSSTRSNFVDPSIARRRPTAAGTTSICPGSGWIASSC